MIFVLFLLFSYRANSISVTKDNLKVGDTFYLYAESNKEFNLSGLENFEIVASHSYLSKDKKNRETIKKRYHLRANKEGDFRFIMDKESVSVKVFESALAQDTFIKISGKAPKKAYSNEKFLIKYNLLSKKELSYAKFKPIASKNNFRSFHVENKIRRSFYNGHSYNKFGIDVLVCSFKNPGIRKIPARQLDLEMSNSKEFHGEFVPAYLESEEYEIEIIPLPDRDKDVLIVGQVDLGHTFVQKDNGVILNLIFAGKANLDKISSLYSIDNVEIIEESTLEEKIDSDHYLAERKFDVKFTSKTGESFVIPEKVIEYFEPDTKTYKKLVIPSYSWTKKRGFSFTMSNKVIGVLIVLLIYLVIKLFYIFSFSHHQIVIFKLARAKTKKKMFAVLQKYILKKRKIDIDQATAIELKTAFGEELGRKILDFKHNISLNLAVDIAKSV